MGYPPGCELTNKLQLLPSPTLRMRVVMRSVMGRNFFASWRMLSGVDRENLRYHITINTSYYNFYYHLGLIKLCKMETFTLCTISGVKAEQMADELSKSSDCTKTTDMILALLFNKNRYAVVIERSTVKEHSKPFD